MTATEWQIIEPKLDILCNELDKVLGRPRRPCAIDRITHALGKHGELTWSALQQYTHLHEDRMGDALSVLMLDEERVGKRTSEGIHYYYLRAA